MRNLFIGWLAAVFSSTVAAQQVNIVPQPVSVKVNQGTFTISPKTVIAVANEGDRKAADFLNGYLQQFYGFKLDVDRQEGKDYIRLTTRQFAQAPAKDAYQLNVTGDGATIEGDTHTGTFYGMQSLIQLLPVPEGGQKLAQAALSIPQVSIQDEPRFAYRGLHLDVGRHLYPVSFIKKYIDYIALHKMNYFHWHLTEDQGWRIEIKKYPRLTEVGAYRNGTIIGRYPGTGNDNTRYGGFYTQEEVKDIVQYAADRHITVIPEIELPGHASAAIAAYNYLSCFPEEKTKIPGPASEASQQASGKLVQETWGVFEDVFCAGKDSTFQFLQDVMDEILPLFPSKYIHIGGDECPKDNWKRCPSCQKRMKDEGLKDEHELQSYFIQRMEKYLNGKGRTIIGWDEILEGGLAPNAVVMSWRGEEGGIEAAKQNHDVIMTPGNYVYLDHSQTENEDSVTIGGYTPVEETYSYEPVPKELNAEQGKHVLGAQGNVWTEYMKNTRKVEYQIFPRLSALSEVLWTSKEKKNWNDFERRLPTVYKRYQMWDANYSTAFYDLKASIVPAPGNKGIALKLETKDKSGKLTYGIAGKHLQKNYTLPVVITEPGEVVGMYAGPNGLTDTVAINLHFNKATGKKATLKSAPSKTYPGDGAFTLVNGVMGSTNLARSRDYVGFNGTDLEATIDLGAAQKISQVTVHFLAQPGSWIYAPTGVEVLGSGDGKTFKPLGLSQNAATNAEGKGSVQVELKPTTARYVKVVAKSQGTIPQGQPGGGSKAWLFVDEIAVN